MDNTELSKIISHALRHEPQLYNLTLDDDGWVSLSDVIISLNNKGLNVDVKMIVNMVEKSKKKRHEIIDGKIRAYYGHSLSKKIIKVKEIPPNILYHGTIATNVKSIMEKGLLPQQRQYVHLSMDIETAQKVGSRRYGNVKVLKIKAQEAHSKGNINFYKEENSIWLSDAIPSKYIIFK